MSNITMGLLSLMLAIGHVLGEAFVRRSADGPYMEYGIRVKWLFLVQDFGFIVCWALPGTSLACTCLKRISCNCQEAIGISGEQDLLKAGQCWTIIPQGGPS